jgi:ATP-binding cassette subfamily B protein
MTSLVAKSGRFLARRLGAQALLGEQIPAVFGVLAPTLRRYRLRFLVVALMLPVSTLMATLVPFITAVAIDDYVMPAVDAGSMEAYYAPLLELTMMGVVVVILGYVADAVYVQTLQRVGQRLIAELRELVYGRTLRLSRSYFDKNPIGSILTRVTSDIEALGESLAGNVLSLVVDLLKTVAFLAMMFYLNWRLTVVLLLAMPLLIILMLFFQARVRATFFRARQALSEATGFLQECLNGMKTVQLYAAEQKAVERFKIRNRKFYDAQNWSNIYDSLLNSLVEGLTTLTLALVLWYASGELLAGVLTLGVLIAFIEYIQRLFVPIRELTQQLAVMQRALAALDHIGGLLLEPLDAAEPIPDSTREPMTQAAPDGRRAQPDFERLAFDDVRFRYLSGGPEVLRGVSFELERGQTMAIVGPTGSGKSSIIRLLTRTYGGYEGEVSINGIALPEWDRDSLGRMISVVHQNVFLFSGSIRFNIGLGRARIDDAKIEAAAKYVYADRFIDALDGGLDYQVSHGGGNLSAGQAQLLAFARAVAADADVIVLDEATSSVDSLTESLIERALERLYADKTVIAIAHRLSTIRNADRILVLDAGQVVEAGSHESLLALDGAYARLVRASS